MTSPMSKAPENESADDVRQRLRALRVDPPDAGFAATLHRRLVAAGAPPQLGWTARLRLWAAARPGTVWPMVGVATAAAAFALLINWRGPGDLPARPNAPALADAVAAYQLPAAKVALIRFSFTAEIAVEDVDFAVTVPEGLAFWSGGEKLPERTFRWRGRLAAGDNQFPIAVRGERPGRYRVRVTADMDGERIEHDVVLDVGKGA